MCIEYIHVCHCCGVELQYSIIFCDDMENCGGVYSAEIDGGLCSICQNSDTDMFKKEDGHKFCDQVRIIQILIPVHFIKLNSWKMIIKSLSMWIRKFKLKACSCILNGSNSSANENLSNLCVFHRPHFLWDESRQWMLKWLKCRWRCGTFDRKGTCLINSGKSNRDWIYHISHTYVNPFSQ